MRASSARVCSTHSSAPSRSNCASASSSVARAAPRRFARRWVRPSASSVRACWNGSGLRRCSDRASSNVAKAPSRSPPAARSSARQRARTASAHARSSASARSCQSASTSPASPSSPTAISASSRSPSSSRCAGSSMRALRVSYARLSCGSAAFGSPHERSRKPSTQLWPDSSIGIPSASPRAIASFAQARASSIRPRCAAMTVAGKSGAVFTSPSCAESSNERAAYRSASSQFPARQSRKASHQSADASPRASPRSPSTSRSSRSNPRAASSSTVHTS